MTHNLSSVLGDMPDWRSAGGVTDLDGKAEWVRLHPGGPQRRPHDKRKWE